MAAPDGVDVPRWLRVGMVVLVAAMVVIGWAPRLSWGFILDETFTAWQAQGGWAGIIPAKLANPGQSALFAFLEAPFFVPGSPHMELLLRVPALLGTAASCFFLYRLSETIVGKGTGALAVLPFVGNLTVLIYSTQARPYALATAACLAALWGLARWLETGLRRHGLTFAVALALVVHLHLLFAPFALVPAVVVWARARRGLRVDYRGLAGWLAVTAILLLPLVAVMRDVARHRGLSPFKLPRFPLLVEMLVPGSVLLASVAFVTLLLLPAVRRPALRAAKAAASEPALLIALAWLIAPPVVLFAVAHLVHQAVFIDRYLLHTVAAQALIVALAFRGFPPALARIALLACFLPFPIIWGLRDRTSPDGPGSWRRPFETVRALDLAAKAPVFLQAGHPLANAMDWQHGVAQDAFIYSPLNAYPLPNPVYPLPFAVDEATNTYAQHTATELSDAPLLFYVGMRAHPMTEWVRTFFAAHGYAPTYAIHEDLDLLVMRKAKPR
jgi:hypothetical protein